MDGGSSPLDSALVSGDPDQQVDALIELIKGGDGAAVAKILPLVDSDDAAVRSEAVRAIGYLGIAQAPVIGPVLMRMLSDSDEMVRNEAAEALGIVRYQPAGDALVSLLGTEQSWMVRASIAEALGAYPGQAAAALVRCVREVDEFGEVRRYAIGSLARTGDLTCAEMSTLVAEFGHEPEIGPQLRIAAYRLGDQTQLDEIAADAARLDEDESARLLNDIEDLLRSPQPPTLPEDAARIETILNVVAMRWPLYSRQAGAIRDKLPK
ncbi:MULTISPECIES: HEAT repeat domain-containing protein [unclassified Nocardia]|uniref:HEAT repeat domain-containing protein n=1 Tax=unclassified Nocardia TaxID=2637762 RepID=UPI001CE4B4D4|nr:MULTISPECIES: HEAT repeat domain-containing protein [unclassified Nocardia]